MEFRKAAMIWLMSASLAYVSIKCDNKFTVALILILGSFQLCTYRQPSAILLPSSIIILSSDHQVCFRV